MIFSIFYWIYFLAVGCVMTPIFMIVGLLALPFDRKRLATNALTVLWAWLLVRPNPFWRLTFDGKEKIEAGKAYVLAANHQSHFDVFVLFLLGHPIKWLAKKSLLYVPFVGWVMAVNGYVLVLRSDPESRKRAFEKCRDWLALGISMFFFPEGTRSLDGELKSFHAGAFRLAMEAGVPVLPVVIDGTRQILPKKSARLAWKGEIRVKVLDPVSAESAETLTVFQERVRREMKAVLDQMRVAKAPRLLREA